MNKERAICFNCNHWALEPDALDKRERDLAKRMAGDETKVPADMYGKCGAIKPNLGTLAPTECVAFDDDGNKLFEPVPVD